MTLYYLKTPAGCLKVLHVVLEAIALGMVGHHSLHMFFKTELLPYPFFLHDSFFFFLLVTFAFSVPSFLLLVSGLMEAKTDSLSKSFEILYHAFGFIFHFVASATLIYFTYNREYKFTEDTEHALYMYAAAVCGLANSLAYLANACLAFLKGRK